MPIELDTSGGAEYGLVSLIRLGWRVDRYSARPSGILKGEQLTYLLLQPHWTPSCQMRIL